MKAYHWENTTGGRTSQAPPLKKKKRNLLIINSLSVCHWALVVKSSSSDPFEPYRSLKKRVEKSKHTHTLQQLLQCVCFGLNVWNYNESITDKPTKTKDQVYVYSTPRCEKKSVTHFPTLHIQTVGMATGRKAYPLHLVAQKYRRFHKNAVCVCGRGKAAGESTQVQRGVSHMHEWRTKVLEKYLGKQWRRE